MYIQVLYKGDAVRVHPTGLNINKGCRGVWCLDVCATPQLDTVTLRPALSDTVTIRPMSCCGLATQHQQYDYSSDFSSRVFSWGPNCHCNDSPHTGHLLVTIRPAWQYDTTVPCKVVCMRWPNLTRGMVDPTQKDTIDPCLGGVPLGGSCHIWG